MIHLNASQKMFTALSEVLKLPSGTKPERALKEGLRKAMELELSPALIQVDYLSADNAKPYYVSPDLMISIKRKMIEQKEYDRSASLASTALGLLSAVIDRYKSPQQQKRKKSDMNQWLENAGLGFREEQSTLIAKSIDALSQKPDGVIMAEASVGVGKTHALAAIAIYHAMKKSGEKKGCVVLAAPNYALAQHLLAATQQLIINNDLRVTVEIQRSRQEYISQKMLQQLLADEELSSDLLKSVEALLAAKKFTRSSYEEVGLDTNQLTLTKAIDPEDAGELAYQQARKDVKDAQIIICTHALVACHVSLVRRTSAQNIPDKKLNGLELNKHISVNNDTDGLLPTIDLLLVDEAHTLYDSYRALRNIRISLSSMLSALSACVKLKLSTQMNYNRCEALIDGFKSQIHHVSPTQPRISATVTNKLADALKEELKLLRHVKQRHARYLTDSIDELYAMRFKNARFHEVYLSPIRENISIQTVDSNPIDWLDMTWRLVSQAIMTSGTLSLAGKYAQMAVKVMVPASRLVEVAPIETNWLRRNVTLHLPLSDTESPWLTVPPFDAHIACYQAWIKGQSEYIKRRLTRHGGGALILCTSYDQVSTLGEELDRLLTPTHRILKSEQGVSIASQVKKYKATYFDGLTPVWIAISTVGVGIDLTDNAQSPDEDKMLSHVFITRLPLPRVQNKNYLAVIRDAVIQFRQWCGRLVRRPGRKDMHLYILDQRAVVKKGPFKQFYSQIRKYETTNKIV